jgi:hypothetical protein
MAEETGTTGAGERGRDRQDISISRDLIRS